jgi:hypothetical protein
MTQLNLEEKIANRKLLYYKTHDGVVDTNDLWANSILAHLEHAKQYDDYGGMWTPTHWLANTCLMHMGYHPERTLIRAAVDLEMNDEYKRLYDLVATVKLLKVRSDLVRNE